jgi:hypothetical protein
MSSIEKAGNFFGTCFKVVFPVNLAISPESQRGGLASRRHRASFLCGGDA